MRADQVEIPMRIVVRRPAAGVAYSLQTKDGGPFDSKASANGGALAFDFTVRVGPGPMFLGDQVRREGSVRRFVYIRIGKMAGDAGSPWSRRMKIDIHDLDSALLDRAAAGEGVIEMVVDGTAKDGSPACATVKAESPRIV